MPGPKSETSVNTRLMPFFAAHCAIGWCPAAACARRARCTASAS
jgi:hypothetical protein